MKAFINDLMRDFLALLQSKGFALLITVCCCGLNIQFYPVSYYLFLKQLYQNKCIPILGHMLIIT